MSNETTMWMTLTPTIIGGAIAIVGSMAAPICVEYVKRRQERSSLAAAIVSEVSALVKISERRHYIEDLRAAVATAKAQSDPNISRRFYFSSRRNSFAVYEANIGRLGILRDPLPQLIVRFYTQAASILEDIADMREDQSQRNRDDSIRNLEALLKLFEDTHLLGHQIIESASIN
jgi:hypothetical protein